MEDAWLKVFSYLQQRDLLRLESISHSFRRRLQREFRRRDRLDFQDELRGATASEERILGLLQRSSPCLKYLIIGSSPLCSLSPSSSPTTSSTLSDSFASSDVVTRRIIETIAKTATRLKSLTLHRMQLTLPALTALPLLPPTIEELVITTCRLDCYSEADGDLIQAAFAELLQKLSGLRRFEISGRGVYDHFVLNPKVMAKLSDTLTHVNLSACDTLMLDDLGFIKQKELSSFTLTRSWISGSSLAHLTSVCPLLRDLDLSYSRNIADFSAIARLPHLNSLNLAHNRAGLGDDDLLEICSGCPALRSLSIEGCERLSGRGLKGLGLLFSLRVVSLSGLAAVDVAVIEALGNCTELDSVDVSFCRKLCPSSLWHLLTAFPSLRLLYARGVSACSYAFLASVPKPYPLVLMDAPLLDGHSPHPSPLQQ